MSKSSLRVSKRLEGHNAYLPGEQPEGSSSVLKLNTNENPYPPSPKVLLATRAAVDGRLRLYPNPTAQSLREQLAFPRGGRASFPGPLPGVRAAQRRAPVGE